MTALVHPSIVEFWFDPVCPYSRTASRWLHEVGHCRPLTVRHHVMSLYLLNEHRTDVAPIHRRNVETSRGPARVATAVVSRFGPDALDRFYTALGEVIFDHWRRPSADEYQEVIRAALPRVGLPGELTDAGRQPAVLRAQAHPVTPASQHVGRESHGNDDTGPSGRDVGRDRRPARTHRRPARAAHRRPMGARVPVRGLDRSPRRRPPDHAAAEHQGPEIAGPIGALLLLLTGRDAAQDHLTGDGADALRSTLSRSV